MDLAKLNTVALGVAYGGTVDKNTFQEIANLARRFLVEEKQLLDQGKQIEVALAQLREFASAMVEGQSVSRNSQRIIERLQKKMDAQLSTRKDWLDAANRQQRLIEGMLNTLQELTVKAQSYLDNPTEETANVLRSQIAEQAL